MISLLDPKTLTAFVTGATSGFGEAICHRFHEAGAKVVGTGRRKDRLDALKKQLGERCQVIELDVTDRDRRIRRRRCIAPGFPRSKRVRGQCGSSARP